MKYLLLVLIALNTPVVHTQIQLPNDLAIDMLNAAIEKQQQLDSIQAICGDPTALIGDISNFVDWVETQIDLMVFLAEPGREQQLMLYLEPYLRSRHEIIHRKLQEYLEIPCPNHRLHGRMYFIKEGLEYSRARHLAVKGLL